MTEFLGTDGGQIADEVTGLAWLGEPGRPQPGARFTGHNRFPNGSEYEVTCVGPR